MSQSAGRTAVLAAFFPFVWLYRKLFRKHWRAIDEAYGAENARERAAELRRAAEKAADGSAQGESEGKGKGKGKKKRKKKRGRDQSDGSARPESTSESTAPEATNERKATSYDWRPLCILIAVAAALTIQEYYGKSNNYVEYFPYDRNDPHWQLGMYIWMVGWRVLCYAVIPIAVILLMPGERLRDYYIKGTGERKHLWLYVIAIAVMALIIGDSARDDSFYRFALFDKLKGGSDHDFLVWLIAFPVQFIALEFCFRSFLLHGLRRSLGSKAIFVMMVPYCMIHYGKPFPPFSELLTALMAAMLLGTLAMRTRSIWGPAIVHMAATMALELVPIDHWILLAVGAPLMWLLRGKLVEHWRAIDESYREDNAREVEVERDGEDGPTTNDAFVPGTYDWRPLVVLTVVAISLSLQEGYGQRGTYREYFPRDASNEYWQLGAFIWWSGWRVFGYIVLPVIAILLMPGERLRDYYISFIGFFKHLWIYGVLFLAILPAVIIAAQTESFYRTYPFYKLANRTTFDFWAWEFLYVVQFLSLEFFFRGFMLHGLRRSMGSMAIVVMCVSYCMIHYGKPLPETMGAIFAGIILGTLAMRTRSIWGGVLIHAGVAVSMDALAIQHCPSAESGLPCRGH